MPAPVFAASLEPLPLPFACESKINMWIHASQWQPIVLSVLGLRIAAPMSRRDSVAQVALSVAPRRFQYTRLEDSCTNGTEILGYLNSSLNGIYPFLI